MTIQEIEQRLIAVEQSVMELQRSRYPMVSKVDDTSNRVDRITPYTDTKTAYYGDTSVTFYDVPDGHVSVFMDDYNGDYSISRIESRLVVSFDALDKQTAITISIQ